MTPDRTEFLYRGRRRPVAERRVRPLRDFYLAAHIRPWADAKASVIMVRSE
jgi:hypothetical protein